MKQLSNNTINRIKTLLFCCCLIPLVLLLADYASQSLGADPVARITRSTGIWGLNFLLVTLMITPLRKWTHWNWLMRLRRTLAMYAFFYSALHLTCYLLFDQAFDWAGIGRDIARRPFITAGMASFVLMVPLALTSTTAMMKRMGGRNWQALHRLAYPAAAAAALHYFWLVKRDITQPSIYLIILMLLFIVRLAKPRHTTPALSMAKDLNRA